MDVQTSKTKRTFAELQEKVLRDATAGSMANPLRISGASLAGKTKQAAVCSWVLPSITLHLLLSQTAVSWQAVSVLL